MRALFLVLSAIFLAVPGRSVDRDAARATYRQGNDLFDHYRFPEAAAAYAQAIDKDPQFLEAYFNHALADEMVERHKAMADWRQFVELAAGNPDFVDEVGQAKARVQVLRMLPEYPEALQPSRYVSGAADYYADISENSESHKWNSFPIQVSLGDVPTADWAQGEREAFRIWKSLFPLELTAEADEADIIFTWSSGTTEENHAGEETDWVQFRRVGGELTGRKVAYINVDTSRRWSKDEMRAIVLHELGHALGIQGHSDSKSDIMFWQMQENNHHVRIPGIYYPFAWKSLVGKPSQRDLNTLIRLYNTPGSVVRMK